jgi:nitrous oxide reductase accessory protein NosL
LTEKGEFFRGDTEGSGREGNLQTFYQPQDRSKMICRRTFCRQALYLLAGVIIIGTAPGVANAGGGVAAGRLGLDEQNRMQISPQDRCPVCGMKVIRYPKFSSAIRLGNQDTYYFCSNGCMLKAWLHPEIFLKSTRQALSLAVVRDYFSGRQVDAQDVFWIAGSDVIGPMGPAMVALQGSRSLTAFLKRHGGCRVFRLQELNDDLWLSLTGKPSTDQ